MLLPIFRTVYKKKEAKICLLFSLLPLILIFISILPTNFMQINAIQNSISLMDFFDSVEGVLFQMVLPTIAFMYLSISCVHDEIKKSIIYLYKDIPRIKVLCFKAISIMLMFCIYIIMTFLTSTFTYLFYINNQPYSSHQFIGDGSDVLYITVNLFGIWASSVIGILMVVVISTFAENVVSLIIGIIYILFCIIAPDLKNVYFLFPTGYKNIFENLGFGKSMFFSCAVSVLYLLIICIIGIYSSKRIEF